jgi:hypothetical protein
MAPVNWKDGRDPHFLRLTQRIRESQARYRVVAAPVLADLAAADLRVTAVSELKQLGRYDEAIPILLKWLPQVSDDSFQAGIVSALGVPHVGPRVAEALLDAYPRTEHPAVRDAIGSALSVVAEESSFDRMVALARNKDYGWPRWSLISAIGTLKTAKAEPVLVELLRDETAAGAVLVALSNRGAQLPAALIKPFLRHKDSLVRAAARRLLRPPTAPLRPHLVRSDEGPPESLAEWSAGLDLEDLGKALLVVGRAVGKGLGKAEVAEVVSVAEDMKRDETRWLRFRVRPGGKEFDLWLALFLDDVNAIDLSIHASQPLIDKLEKAWVRSSLANR